MNAAHLHLLVNHAPIVLAGAGLLFLLPGGSGRGAISRGAGSCSSCSRSPESSPPT